MAETKGKETSPVAEPKRKSVSFVDEKLIINAMKSTGINNNHHSINNNSNNNDDNNNNKSVENRFGHRSGHSKFTNYNNNGRNGNGKNRKPANQNGGHHRSMDRSANVQNWRESGQTPSPATDTAAATATKEKKAVIIYYNNPDVDLKSVDELLSLPEKQPSSQPEKPDANLNQDRTTTKWNSNPNNPNNNHLNSKNPKYSGRMANYHQKTNGSHGNNHHHHHHHHNPNQNVSRPNKPGVSSSNSNNNHSNGNNFKNGTNFKKPHYENKKRQDFQIKYDDDNGGDPQRPKPDVPVVHKTEPITIYYNNASVSLEENLKKFLSKSFADGDDDGAQTNQPKTEVKTKESPKEDDQETKPSSSQTAVIDGEDSSGTLPEQPPEVPMESNEEDVISGGVAIENPRLPSQPGQMVTCTIVSHPGHFYVKFVDDANEQQLRSMTAFYQNDEQHIDLTVDVLKPGQYYAAHRAEEWIRVKVLHVEAGADLINCLLIDEGCCGTFKLANLQPLYNRFRSVPKQAVRVALSGVRPKETDWLPAQALEFKKLVENKRLRTGTVSDQQPEMWDEQQNSIEIELFFAEPDDFQDQSVADILVQRDIAIKK